jgi:hypothetical protein
MGVRDYLNSRRDDDRDDRGRGRDDDRGRDRDDDRGRGRDDRDDRDDRDRDDDRRSGRGPEGGRFTGMRSSTAQYDLVQDDNMILRIDKTFETDNTQASWFHGHFDIIKVFDSPRKLEPGAKCSILHGTDKRSIAASGPRITSFVRAAAGFDNDEDFHRSIPKISKSGKAKYSELIDAALGVPKAEKEFGQNPLGGSYVEVVGRKGKYDDKKRVQYYEYTWIPVGKQDSEDYDEAWEKLKETRSSRRDDRDRGSDRGAGRGAERDDDARSERGRGGRVSDDDRDDRGERDRDDEREDRGRDSERGGRREDRGRGDERDSRPARDRDDRGGRDRDDDRGRDRSDERSRDDRDRDDRGGRGGDDSRRR